LAVRSKVGTHSSFGGLKWPDGREFGRGAVGWHLFGPKTVPSAEEPDAHFCDFYHMVEVTCFTFEGVRHVPFIALRRRTCARLDIWQISLANAYSQISAPSCCNAWSGQRHAGSDIVDPHRATVGMARVLSVIGGRVVVWRSLDDLISAGEQRGWNFETEGLRPRGRAAKSRDERAPVRSPDGHRMPSP
jgi:hypothetical protein